MAKGNAYLTRISDMIKVHEDAAADTYMQFTLDMVMLTLNDPDIMGKDVFGKSRIRKVMEGVKQKYEYYKNAVESGKTRKEQEKTTPEYYQAKLDDALRSILGEEGFVEFDERYPWLKKIRF